MERIEKVVNSVSEDKILQGQNKLGLCRKWTFQAIRLLNKGDLPEGVKISAREVDLELGLSHTFVRISTDEGESYLWDGVGTAKYEPFFGRQEEAPEHLQESRKDIINSYQ